MKHEVITVVFCREADCRCPRCGRERFTGRLCLAAGLLGFILIPGRIAVAVAARAIGF